VVWADSSSSIEGADAAPALRLLADGHRGIAYGEAMDEHLTHTPMSSCRICHNTAAHPTFCAKEMQFGTRAMFEYFRCASCGCLQIDEIPSDLARYYPENYYSFHPAERRTLHGRAYRELQKVRVANRLVWKHSVLESLFWRFVELPYEWQQCTPYLPADPGRGMRTSFLDVGCGERSWWLEALEELGFGSLTGVDPFMRGDHRRGRVSYRRCGIAEVGGRYDFISFHHSLEHIPEQHATLRAARALLNDQGTCLVRVPVVPSYLWDKYGVCWMGLDAPRHLYLHTRESMRIAAERAGFVVERVFFDMDEVTLIASEQYLKDIPMFGERSYFSSPADSEITPAQAAALRSLAARLNAEERADCAAFVLKPA